MDSLIDVGPTASRLRAAQRIAGGGVLALLGTAAFAVGVALPTTALAYIGGVVGGIALAGVGLLRVGHAATHLMRYGVAGSARTLVAAGGLGASLVTFAATHVMLIANVEAVRPLYALSTLGVAVFGTTLAVLGVRAIVRRCGRAD